MTDFSTIVSELRATGLTQRNIADKVEAGISTIADLESNKSKQPSYRLGVRLVELHEQRVGEASNG